MKTNPVWILLDGSNYVHRDLHAAGAARVGGVMRRRLQAMIDTMKPERIAVCYDEGETWRRSIEPTYKAGRPPKPPELDQAIDDAQHACIIEGCDILNCDTFEADDIIATLCKLGVDNDRNIVVGSADRDLHQLLQVGRVNQLLSVRRSRDQLQCDWLTATKLVEQFGVTPEQWVDYRMLVGDKSDNISGVDGIGKETAAKLLADAGTIEAFFANPFAFDLTPRQRTKLFNSQPQLPHLRRLITLRTDVPIPYWTGEFA